MQYHHIFHRDMSEQVEPELESDSKWYLSHHPVLHPHKPKISVVFDCGAEFAGNSLHFLLLKGPDFVSSLIGVLTRFRKENVAVVGDIKEMYHQVFVDPKNRQYLRFLWWPGDDLTSEPVIHQMNVHLQMNVQSYVFTCLCSIQPAAIRQRPEE